MDVSIPSSGTRREGGFRGMVDNIVVSQVPRAEDPDQTLRKLKGIDILMNPNQEAL